jgi:hypothetical protein
MPFKLSPVRKLGGGGLGSVGQNKMCCNMCRLVGGIAALFILRSVGILSFVLLFFYCQLCRLLGLLVTFFGLAMWRIFSTKVQ